MSTIDNGGPAFPVADLQAATPKTTDELKAMARGMTLRDYFAAKAMQGFLGGHITHYGHENHWSFQDMAGEAYTVADAMLKERSKA